MKLTSAEAAKLIRRLNNERDALLYSESQSSSFLAAVGEDVESVRPKYDYAETGKKLDEIEARIRKIKHALNLFNATSIIPEFNITVDEMLILIPQLTQKLSKLNNMKSVLPKAREAAGYGRNNTIIDYRYANYDIDKVSEDYDKTAEQLAAAQLALDKFNSTVTMELGD